MSLKAEFSLAERVQPQSWDRRGETRRGKGAERAIITFRGQEHIVPVVDISSRGARIVCDIAPAIGETISVQFEKCSRIQAFVRWLRDGQVGLNFGHVMLLGG